VPRPDHTRWVVAGVLSIASALAWSAWAATGDARGGASVLATQLAIAGAMAYRATPPRRTLAAMLALVVPMLGALAATWVLAARGRGGSELLHAAERPRRQTDRLEIARRLTTTPASCEALVSTDLETRRATIGRLSLRATADDLAILRWARKHPDPDLALEVALALEDVGRRFEERVGVLREAARNTPNVTNHGALVRAIADGIIGGELEVSLAGAIAAEAREHHEAMATLDVRAARVVLASRVRLELVMHRAETALDLLEAVPPDERDAELDLLRARAAYAARRFDRVPELDPKEIGNARA
jgi:hypothetical protein